MQRQAKAAILALCAALSITSAVAAQGKPKAVVDEPIKDVGTVPKGEKIVHDFVIRNAGDAPLQITQVQPACGCTVADFDKTVAPGQTGKIHAAVDTATFNGAIAKGVTVFTNDPDTPSIELTIKAKVEPYISVKPGYARYIYVKGEPGKPVIGQTLWTPDGTAMDIVGVDSPKPYLKTSFREARAEERQADVKGKQWRVEIELADDAPTGALAETVTIRTNHPKQKMVQIPISGFVRPVLAVTPPVADFGNIELKEPLRKAVNIRNFATEPIKVTSVEKTSLDGVDATLEPLTDGREYQVRVVLKPEMGKGPFNGKLTIHTDSPKMPVIEVPLKGVVM